MADNVVRTGVDELLDLLKITPKITIADAAKKLQLQIDVIQTWVDFLVEENIIGVEYNFTTPYIYLNKKVELQHPQTESQTTEVTIDYYKRQFIEKARINKIPENQILLFWAHHLKQALEQKKNIFLFEAKRKNINNPEILWQEYTQKITNI